MDYKRIEFKNETYVLIEQNNRYSLYRFDIVGKDEAMGYSMQLLDFAENLKSLQIDKQSGLVLTPSDVYLLDGRHLAKFAGKDAIICRLDKNTLVLSCPDRGTETGGQCDFLLWNNKKVLLYGKCQEYSIGSKYFAIRQNTDWVIYNSNGKTISLQEPVSAADEIKIVGKFLIKSGLGGYTLYSLKTGKCVCEKQQSVDVSTHVDFAIYMAVNYSGVNVHSFGKKAQFAGADMAKIIGEFPQLFCIRRNKKYFIYTFDLQPVLDDTFPDGVDFVSYNHDDGFLLIINNGKPTLFFR